MWYFLFTIFQPAFPKHYTYDHAQALENIEVFGILVLTFAPFIGIIIPMNGGAVNVSCLFEK